MRESLRCSLNAHGYMTNIFKKPELMIIPLRLPVQVYSGVTPPKALLEAMGVKSDKQSEDVPPPPPPRPTLPGYEPPSQTEELDEAPPSYEDAMADALGPVDGPRREYNPPDTTSGTSGWTGTDVKGPVENNKDERLFSSSGTHSGSTDSFDMYYPASPMDGTASPVSQDKSGTPSGHMSPSAQSTERLELRPGPPPRRISPLMGMPARKPVPGQEKPKSNNS